MARKPLTGEDRQLWKKVAKSATPLNEHQRNLEAELAALLDLSGPDTASPPPRKIKPRVPSTVSETLAAPAHEAKPNALHPAQPIDPPVLKKLAKGKLDVDARLDLHGMTANMARERLVDFLELSRAAGHRIVLVITGKGLGGTGVLRSSLPHWLELPPCTHLVNGYRAAHVSHGGDGAFYVRLRRPRARGGRGLR